jgi:energy-converting hydrogenase Eha subunit H
MMMMMVIIIIIMTTIIIISKSHSTRLEDELNKMRLRTKCNIVFDPDV